MKDKEFKALVDNLNDGVYFVDVERTITYWNKAAEKLTGYSADEVLGKHCFANILDHCDGRGNQLCFGGCPLHATLTNGKAFDASIFLRQKNGLRRPVSVRVAPIRDEEDNIVGAVEVFCDNSSKLAVLEELELTEDMALLDELTGVCNRRSLDEFLKARHGSFVDKNFPYGLYVLNVDRLGEINAAHDLPAGDKVLKMVADILVSSSRSFDVVGRWEDNEFMIIFSNIGEKRICEISERHRMLIEKSFVELESEQIAATASFGATLARGEDSLDEVVERAGKLLLESKEGGRNRVTFG